ncbi:MAG TPA: signal recognition particle receptor subunit alpha, partial [Verrucomicrobiota bacterium]|nr:signal recognition particle receptor subunit alpha [Verrucomicrobiota bacterium]
MGLFQKLKEGLGKTHSRLVHEIRRIVTGSPRLTGTTLEQLEAALLGADIGRAVTAQIVNSVKEAYESKGNQGADVLSIARDIVERSLSNHSTDLARAESGLTVVSVVGVNGTGKTTTCAKLAEYVKKRGQKPMLAACDTFRAAAIEQLKLWGQRLDVPVVAGTYNADPASVAHDAVTAAMARGADYLFVDTAGRLHTKNNLMQELQKVHRVMGKKLQG